MNNDVSRRATFAFGPKVERLPSIFGPGYEHFSPENIKR